VIHDNLESFRSSMYSFDWRRLDSDIGRDNLLQDDKMHGLYWVVEKVKIFTSKDLAKTEGNTTYPNKKVLQICEDGNKNTSRETVKFNLDCSTTEPKTSNLFGNVRVTGSATTTKNKKDMIKNPPPARLLESPGIEPAPDKSSHHKIMITGLPGKATLGSAIVETKLATFGQLKSFGMSNSGVR
jgi:hypothetical protein